MKSKKPKKTDEQLLMDSLDAYIEYADALTDNVRKTYSDAEFYRKLRAYIISLQEKITTLES